MNGREHYAEAERLLDEMSPEKNPGLTAEGSIAYTLRAQTHATLALVAATVDAANRMVWTANQDGNGHEIQNSLAWSEVTA